MADNYWVAGKPDKKVEVVDTMVTNVSSKVDVGAVVSLSMTVQGNAFTDGGGASGTFTLAESIPAGATVLKCVCTSVSAFSGDTTAIVKVGDGTDPDRYTTGSPSVFASSAAGVSLGGVSGQAYHSEAKQPVITITGGSDWGSVADGKFAMKLYYVL